MKRPFPMQEAVTFQAKVETGDDGAGNRLYRWEDQFRAFAHIDFKGGQEALIGGSLQGLAPGVLTIRASAKAREVKRTWRIKHRGRVYGIKEPPRLSERRTHITMIIEGKD
ncbi:phage head closure protein [Mesobacterium sp. TK19101]|uniref:Phage head closure protein n=1 Tax=Mesobacterium hydrothermale TaxID=3111907 RepID=A0ABU6HLH3_9RHOB|nr:phage head closure protein [Mesobacterium sp. TK19101]MEC3863312.1 phage head closure protein [Mesobacterium sp. TK19101]